MAQWKSGIPQHKYNTSIGISEVILTITNQTVIQIGIDNQYQGRVFSVSEAGWNCSLLIGSVIGGLLNDWLSLTFTFTTLGAILALYSIYQLFTFLKTSKNVNNNIQKTNIDS
ncbi:MFS transporter [Rummeliibacillus sp. SL167]|uniref:MFS transporter n=1 Tax=Rummeliibacillus sp. SL167 TaxID=2579792 RepID=UPI0011B5F55E|nr:MFS transporter [Rummeliibacillus sp. SL167]